MKFLYAGGGITDAYGIVTAPNHKGIPADIKAGKPWAADLGCLVGPDFVKKIDFNRVLEWLPAMMPYIRQCIFVAGADIVFDAEGTLEAYEEFKHYFAGWPLAYVAQNGAEDLQIPSDCAAVFIGGDTSWKESTEAASVISRALELGKHVHIGRVNWWRRYQLFRALPGSDNFTCDGNRQIFDGREKTLAAWAKYQARERAVRQMALPGAYSW